MHCSEPVAWRGSWRAPNGRHYRVEACEGQVVPAGTEVQVHPAALPLDFIKLAFAVVLTFPWGPEPVVDCGMAWVLNGVRDRFPPGDVHEADRAG
jgi:hypothetical protein